MSRREMICIRQINHLLLITPGAFCSQNATQSGHVAGIDLSWCHTPKHAPVSLPDGFHPFPLPQRPSETFAGQMCLLPGGEICFPSPPLGFCPLRLVALGSPSPPPCPPSPGAHLRGRLPRHGWLRSAALPEPCLMPGWPSVLSQCSLFGAI